jgi:opacity protein-like surface antigen
MRRIVLAGTLLVTIATTVSAQDAAAPNPLLTRRGWEIGGQVSTYKYEEPGLMNLEGERVGFVGAYNFTNHNRVYSRIDFRVSYGKLDYESFGTGTSSDIPDWIGEVRAVVGRDYLVGEGFALSPYLGFGYRYLYNDLRGYSSTGAVGYRRYSEYFYVPIGLTMRMRAGDQWVFAPTVEYDAFLGGNQKSKLSDTGLGFSDAYNDQDRGRGYRVYLMVEGRRWAFGPWLHYWKIKDSDIVPIGFGFGGLEPENWTREYGLEFRYRF